MARTPEIAETRRFDRIRTRLAVAYGPEAPTTIGRVETISEGGLYINTNEVYKTGTRLVVRIDFPDRSITHRAEVVWAIRAPDHLRDSMMCGMGIRFLYPDPQWTEFFRNWNP